MPVETISINKNGGSVSAGLSSPHLPQSLAGVLWRYDSAKQPEGKQGEFTPGSPRVPLGGPTSITGKFFLIEGVVLHQNDNPPTPYQIIVSFTQDGKVLHEQVPPESGSGQIGTEDVPFVYRFQIVST